MSSRPSSTNAGTNGVNKLDFDSYRQRSSSSHGSHHSTHTGLLASDRSFFSEVAEGAVSLDRQRMARNVTKHVSFACAILSCLCAGSITAYSLYGPLFLSHLRYSQYEVNAVSTTAELAMCIPVPLLGWLCDRYNPRPLSLAAAIFFGVGYLLAALTYHAGPRTDAARSGGYSGSDSVLHMHGGWPFPVMITAFAGIGTGTSCMYLSAVTTCAKNFGRGKHRGLALAMPIAAFGLSGMWQSQVGSHIFQEKNGNGDTDVFRYFLFLAGMLFAVGLIGAVGLRVVGEEEMIDEAVDELERSGFLEDSTFFQRTLAHDSETPLANDDMNGNATRYGTLEHDNHSIASKTQSIQDYSALKKTLLLNHSTRLFLTDPTMWFLTLGFFLTTGPGETFINNVGTLLNTLYPPPSPGPPPSNSPATHVSIITLTSTLARLAIGTLSDLLAPSTSPSRSKPCTVSRIWLLLLATTLSSVAQLLLATPLPSLHPHIFPLVSALVGIGYGAIFSLSPIIISVIWSVENFGTNWGIVAVVPAVGAALWGAVYSAVYQAGIGGNNGAAAVGKGEGQCFGAQCYRTTFAAMAVASWSAMLLWGEAYRRWRRRGIAV